MNDLRDRAGGAVDRLPPGLEDWIVPLGAVLGLLQVVVILLVSGWVLLRLPAEPWTERARALHPLTTGAGGVALSAFLTVAMAVVAIKAVGPWGTVQCLLMGLVATLTAGLPLDAVLVRVRGHRMGWREHMGNLVVGWLGQMLTGVVFVLALLLVGDRWEPLLLLRLAGALGVMWIWLNFGVQLLGLVLGLLRRAPDWLTELVAGEARRRGMRPPRVLVLRMQAANAFAWTWQNVTAFTEGAVRGLSREQLAGIAAHELGHLNEPLKVKLVRSLGLLSMAPWLAIRVLIHHGGFFPGLVIAFLLSRLLGWPIVRMARAMEVRADRIAAGDNAEEAAHYVRALENIHRLNLLPAVLGGGMGKEVHPDLYDRMLEAGVQPQFERPRPPGKTLGSLARVACAAVTFLWMIATILLLAHRAG